MLLYNIFRRLAKCFLLIASFALLGGNAQADLRVVTSIKPVHSLVAAVMAGVGTPQVLVSGRDSPHSYSLRPSDAAALQAADVIFWIGPTFETFLQKPVEALPHKANIVSLIDAPGLQLLPVRTGAGFDGDSAGPYDGHIWLDPENAKSMVAAIAASLASADPDHRQQFAHNAEALTAHLTLLESKFVTETAPLAGKPFITFHDATQYFEKRFGLSAVGVIALHPENPPGAKAIQALRQRIREGGAVCVFAEPSFDHTLVDVVTEGTHAKTGVLDAEGALLEPRPHLYDEMLEGLASAFKICLGGG
jgi:zinc transport system substrate-binding protein